MPGKPGARSQRAWSWYRLADATARSIVEHAGIGANELVLDLGAGDGALTRHLARTGARVIAFELHPGRADVLRRRFAADRRVKVVRADVRDLRLPTRPFHVVANPPFDGVSAVLARLTARGSRLERADLVVPRSVAIVWHRRLTRPGSAHRVTGIRPLPRSVFTPRPRIDCCVLTIEPTRR